MIAKEIIDILRKGANFHFYKVNKGNGFWHGYGAINNFPECELEGGISPNFYAYLWYPSKKKILESLPWNIVEHPRMPKDGEYPSEDGDYITMLDADEHAVWVNSYRDGHWCVYDRTHVKWWMPLTDEMKQFADPEQ